MNISSLLERPLNQSDGILRLLEQTKITEEEHIRQRMQAFYEEHTFPGYDGIDSPSVLMDKAGKSGFGKWVDEAISPFATVLEVGCGTGQMTNFLGLVSTRTVIGTDQSIASLTLGQSFKEQFGLQNVHFVQANIFAMPFKPNSMDILICSGVLHHTPNPKKGFEELLKLVKPGGKILIGLYNTYARIPTGIRKSIFSCTGKTFRFLDSHMRRRDVDQSKKEIWFADQYKNPHESWHSVDEVLQWFDEKNVKFLSGVPSPSGSTHGQLFNEHPRGSTFEHILKQLGWMFTIGREGGLFVMVGEKKMPA
ncbi:class I SAM-dependent methyltransferase [Candidatus Peregrinibacteria bacterium]|nr:class I SAM-dependent methyltransferase [Candidatus Peregrinibacteria bacterium]